MDAIDNPSYFSLPSDDRTKFRNFLSLRKWSDGSKNHSGTLSSKVPGQPYASNAVTAVGSRSRCNFRSLIRANSDDTHLFVLGKPRPSDLAPSAHNTGRHQRQGSTGNVISNDLMHQDMVHCEGGDNDVFFNPAKHVPYYNTATFPVNRLLNAGAGRRHSIGSFVNRDRTSANNGAGTDSKNRDLLSSSARRKFKKSGKGGSKMVEDELDILLVSCGESEAATLWVNYLISCFQQISRERKKSPFRLQNIRLEDTLCPIASINLLEKLPDSRLQIIVICPLFLQKLQTTSIGDNALVKITHPNKILAMMLGVQNQLENNCGLKTAFPEFDHWRKMNVKDQDPTFVGDFLGVAMDILSRTWQLREMVNSEPEHADFSVLPKKVKVGQNKLIILFTEPLAVEDVVNVFINKSGHRVEIATVKRRNPYTLQFTIPACCLQVSMLISICIEKNGKSAGKRLVKCESKMRELDQLLRSMDDPVQFLCQSVGLNMNDRDQLDTFLLNNFQSNIPTNFNLLSSSSPIIRNCVCNEEYPTLLHFAAKYGLERLSWLLMESPGGEQACQIRNVSHQTPADMAEKANHAKLANVLRGFMQMTELSSVYTYLKGLSERDRHFVECNYLQPRPLNDTYLIPPAARPVDPLAFHWHTTDSPAPSLPFYTNFKPCTFPFSSATSPASPVINSSFFPYGLENYDIPPPNGKPYTPRTPSELRSPTECKLEGYLDMHSAGPESCRVSSASSFNTGIDLPEHFGSFSKLDTDELASVTSESHTCTKYDSAAQLSNKEKLSPDDEFLEIISDFKNNVFTIAEVEALVESWQNRNDVQQSFRDKQEQLNRMREEYEKIQRKMKEQMKRTTPFEKIRKFFSRGKPKNSESSERTSTSSDVSATQIRAMSSLSLHSSSSTSSGPNSISGGHSPITDDVNERSTSIEKLNKFKPNPYAEIPQPPSCLDLGVNVDFSEYVQPDFSPNKLNTNQTCNGSVLNDTIQECNEHEISDPQSIDSHSSSKRNEGEGSNSPVTRTKCRFNSNSLRVNSKYKRNNKIRTKVKSAENLINDGAENKQTQIPKPLNVLKSRTELSICAAALCAETLKFLSDNISSEEGQSSNNITFIFNKAESCSTLEGGSENKSDKSSSSLNLSSSSINSNCTVDENGEIEASKCSLQLNTTEKSVNETETAPSSSKNDQSYVNICQVPEYVNVNVRCEC